MVGELERCKKRKRGSVCASQKGPLCFGALTTTCLSHIRGQHLFTSRTQNTTTSYQVTFSSCKLKKQPSTPANTAVSSSWNKGDDMRDVAEKKPRLTINPKKNLITLSKIQLQLKKRNSWLLDREKTKELSSRLPKKRRKSEVRSWNNSYSITTWLLPDCYSTLTQSKLDCSRNMTLL